MKGKARTIALASSTGLVEPSGGGTSWDFIYQHSTVKNPDYSIGDRVQLPDGRVFRFAKASGTQNPDVLSQHLTGQHISYVALGASQAIGDSQVTLTVTAGTEGAGRTVGDKTGVIAEDEMRGGYVLIFDADGKAQNRGIIGNTALAATGTSISLYLDGKLNVALLAVTDHAEAIASPYLALTAGDITQSRVRSFLGLPAAIATDGEYFWLQTWGPCWVAPDNGNSSVNVGNSDYNIQVVARFDGHIAVHDYSDDQNKFAQHVGFVLSRGATTSQGLPFIMLQISP